ncbi:glycoside hydrolase family 65 protein [Longirhabdus pacifica]|uniref:glycoside hydrolase family 65 protein n=1 Tax=Longirhabdus pacifica TaxID=2305227 RepID=UPI001008DE7E|nr:glycoside hydrolase family 65 protein [Longirhabdus pacifica]
MHKYLKSDEWKIIEEGFNAKYHEISESLFSIGNGHMGQRANFEEQYSGETLQGNYVAGVYYPDKTRVGWWKNGYPEYFAKVLNATNWIGINVHINQEVLDLNHCEVKDFIRELNMKEGYLKRSFIAVMNDGKQVKVEALRFVSLERKELGAIRYAVTPLNFEGEITLTPYLDGDVKNKDSNYDEKFWDEVLKTNENDCASLTVKTKKLDFHVCSTMQIEVHVDGVKAAYSPQLVNKEKFVSQTFTVKAKAGQKITLYKYVANVTCRDHGVEQLQAVAKDVLHPAVETGFDALLVEQAQAWAKKWKDSDIVIEGDVEAQQGIRFNIFQLNQTYTGEDARLNIGPKGFTGEKYGGSTYWDTEAYCLPFYLSTSDPSIARNLLVYRHKHLEKAKENATKLGFTDGAALYPMVTMNGEECHNEWEITFEEIHRNGAIAYAIYNYVRYTDDHAYLSEYGLEVLAAISRFWAQRVQFVKHKNVYMMLGVTGPNEYENNVNNNWYTNRIAAWTLEYTLKVVKYIQSNDAANYNTLVEQLGLSADEMDKWQHMIDHMYYPVDEETGIFLQQDGFMDKDLLPVKQLEAKHLPLNQNWSWDRILRSCYIKQADVLQGLYFLEDQYDLETKKKNFDFYEPLTVHESSLSPCVHAILACELGYKEKAYEMYLRTSRLDLDNYNNDTEDGCHTTSMAGTWMSVVEGFGGKKVKDGKLVLNPLIPDQWKSFSFKIVFKGATLNIRTTSEEITITNESNDDTALLIYGQSIVVKGNDTAKVDYVG